MILYHGSDKKIIKPSIEYARKNLDFGKGIYFTSYKKQAFSWAMRKKVRYKKSAFINTYKMTLSFDSYRVKDFKNETSEWLEYVLACRNNEDIYKQYDIVIGAVADDNIFKIIDFYNRGIWTKDRIIEEITYFEKNDQICILNQEILDKNIKFIEAEEV